LMGAEGLHQIANSPSTLRLYHSLGVRYVTITHFCHNRYADSASQPPYWHGLSKDGRAMIREMNRIGMIVDLAHTSPDTMRQTLETTDVPVLFSHASAYGVCPHPRNVPNDVLYKLKDNGGVIMITFVNNYINCEDAEQASLSDVADHVEYVGKLIGYEHVGIGSDFDGMQTAPAGLEDVSKYPALLEELASRGLKLEELKGVAGGNALRVLRDVEAASRRMTQVSPLEDDIAEMWA
jgi:membrane dipeptidase